MERFLKDEAFFKNKDVFCLGSTLVEAGKIFAQVIQEREKFDVGMVDAKDNRNCQYQIQN